MFPLIYFIKDDKTELVIVLSLIMLASDYLDGFLARKWKATTITGQVLDPVADKICIMAVGVSLTVFKGFPLLLLISLMMRDLIILMASVILIRKSKDVPASNLIGKIAVGVISICMLVFLFDIGFLKLPTIIAAVFMIPVSLWSYGMRMLRTL